MSIPPEFSLIYKHFLPLAGPGALALGDDAAVFAPPPGRELVIAADAMVEGVHFLPDDPPETLGRKARFAPWLVGTIKASADALASSKSKNTATLIGSLVAVFMPYILWNTVFANDRVVAEVGERPTPFTRYCGPLYTWSKQQRFEYHPTPLSTTP